MLYRYVFDKISTEFRGILLVFVNFAALRRREIPEALTTSCIIYTNWRPKIYIWRLHFSSWSPKGDLRIFFLCSFDWFLYCFQTTLRPFSNNFILFLHFCILFLMYFHNICVLLLSFFCGILIRFSKYFYCICKYEYFTKFRNRLNSY